MMSFFAIGLALLGATQDSTWTAADLHREIHIFQVTSRKLDEAGAELERRLRNIAELFESGQFDDSMNAELREDLDKIKRGERDYQTVKRLASGLRTFFPQTEEHAVRALLQVVEKHNALKQAHEEHLAHPRLSRLPLEVDLTDDEKTIVRKAKFGWKSDHMEKVAAYLKDVLVGEIGDLPKGTEKITTKLGVLSSDEVGRYALFRKKEQPNDLFVVKYTPTEGKKWRIFSVRPPIDYLDWGPDGKEVIRALFARADYMIVNRSFDKSIKKRKETFPDVRKMSNLFRTTLLHNPSVGKR